MKGIWERLFKTKRACSFLLLIVHITLYMEYYVALAGEKIGPLTQFKLVEMLREGEVTPENKVWHKGLDGWLPLGEIPSMVSVITALKNSEMEEARQKSIEEAVAAGVPVPQSERSPLTPPATSPVFEQEAAIVKVPVQVRPFSRFFARMFDYFLVFILVLWFSDVEFPIYQEPPSWEEMNRHLEEMAKDSRWLVFQRSIGIAILLWHLLEGFLLSTIRTTPGKALLGIKVSMASGAKVSASNGIYRSFLVYILGMGLFLPYLMLIAMGFSLYKLMSARSTLWDRWLDLRVDHPPFSVWRILLVIGAFYLVMFLYQTTLQVS